MTLSPIFKNSCEQIAVEKRRVLGHRQPYDPLPAKVLLQHLEVTIMTPEDFPDLPAEQRQALYELSGAVLSLDPRIVLYNPTHSPARFESTMMHECAHILLNHPMLPFDPVAGAVPRDPHCEEEATYLGSCLQIPRRGLLWAIQKKMPVEEIADHFGASMEMVLFRANRVGMRRRLLANSTD